MRHPAKTWARKTEVMESKKCRRHSKIEERGNAQYRQNGGEKDIGKRLVLERFDMEQNKQRLLYISGAGYSARLGKDTQTAMAFRTGGLQRWRETRRKHQFEVERRTPEAFLLLEMESADRGVQRIQRRDVSRCNEKRGMAGRSTRQKTMEEKRKQSYPSRIGKKHAEAQSTNHKKERICS